MSQAGCGQPWVTSTTTRHRRPMSPLCAATPISGPRTARALWRAAASRASARGGLSRLLPVPLEPHRHRPLAAYGVGAGFVRTRLRRREIRRSPGGDVGEAVPLLQNPRLVGPEVATASGEGPVTVAVVRWRASALVVRIERVFGVHRAGRRGTAGSGTGSAVACSCTRCSRATHGRLQPSRTNRWRRTVRWGTSALGRQPWQCWTSRRETLVDRQSTDCRYRALRGRLGGTHHCRRGEMNPRDTPFM